ncbi:MAG: DUF4956 domain-containing protein [Candidatus Melainabacteria bacterium HGW-Melainabacteria-1]|nr:MAG: DUF4956 domain-containing protein [Candidatus Melainabacteria bacterium HGW-Melainabacteria-1]
MLDVALVLFLSFFLTVVVGLLYRYTHTGVSYSQSYVQTLVIMGTVVALIMLVIGSNIARAFAMVGALSIVRFRNAMKETRDIGFMFFSMALGMAVGTRFYMMAVFACLVICCMILVLYKLNLFAKEISERILRIRLPIGMDYQQSFESVFEQHLDVYRLISLETVRAGVLQEVVYSVVLKKQGSPQALLETLRQVNGNQKVTLVLGQQEVDL